MGHNTFNLIEEVDLEKQDLIELYRKSSSEVFTSLNRLAAQICGTPVSLVNFLDDNFQYTVSQTGSWPHDKVAPNKDTVCQHTVLGDELLVINDTLEDERTLGLEVLTQDQSVRFYAGMPIKAPSGGTLGALCVLDHQPKELSEDQQQALRDLAGEVEYRLKLHKQRKKLELNNNRLEEAAAFLSNSTDILWVVDSASFEIKRSKGSEPVFEVEDASLVGENIFDLISEINLQRHIQEWINREDHNRRLGVPVQIEVESGDTKWISVTFTKHQGNILATGRDITKQHQAEEDLKKSLEEKEVLLTEIHHRVKNNLAVVSSMIQLERMRVDNEQADLILMNSESRILTIAKIHEILYETNNFAEVNLKLYVQNLIDSLGDTYNIDRRDIEIELQITDLTLNVNQALPVGLIVNELIINAIEHAFSSKNGKKVVVRAMDQTGNKVVFEVSDNGRGLDVTPEELEEKGGMGFTLINTLKKQLKADLEIESKNGTAFKFVFEKNKNKGSVSAL